MMMPEQAAKILIAVGILLVITGVCLLVFKNIPLGRLPGDIYIKKGNSSFYFPITTSVIISILLSIIFCFAGKK
jgi:uncharacterized membrane protein